MSYSTVPPAATLELQSFEVAYPQEALDDLSGALRSSRIAPETYENVSTHGDRRFGVSRQWILEAKEHWLNNFDW